MKKYNYSISIIFDYGLSSRDETATTLKEAYKKLSKLKHDLTHMSDYDRKHILAIECYIGRKETTAPEAAPYEDIVFYGLDPKTLKKW